MSTIDAFRDHGLLENRLEQEPEQALTILQAISQFGIDMKEVALQLEMEGIAKFEIPYKKLLSSITEKIK